MSVINTNVSSLIAQNAINNNGLAQSTAMQRLSTGLRINGAKDDAAGLAIAAKMTSQIRGLDQANRNANDAISMLQTADGALSTVTDMMQRMRELAVQAANDTNVSGDRTALNGEFSQLKSEIGRIASATQWNTQGLLDGTGSAGFNFQIGANNTAVEKVSVSIGAISAPTNSIGGLTAAQSAITDLGTAIDTINATRSGLGAAINRLTYAADNLANISANTSASRSRIQDTDYAKTSTELARTQIIAQASTAMLAQANQSQQSVLALLK